MINFAEASAAEATMLHSTLQRATAVTVLQWTHRPKTKACTICASVLHPKPKGAAGRPGTADAQLVVRAALPPLPLAPTMFPAAAAAAADTFTSCICSHARQITWSQRRCQRAHTGLCLTL